MTIQLVHLQRPAQGAPVQKFNLAQARVARHFHSSIPGYAPTPLVNLQNLAATLGVAGLYVKDESKRFGLNAFKVLGGSFAIASYIAEKLNLRREDLTFPLLTSPEVKAQLGPVTFVTATDGNHGRGVAWTANRLGQRSVVYMPEGSAPERLQNIRALGSEASITDLVYDDAVRLAKQQAAQNGWVLVQDTDWEGYTKIPGWIMQGYTTLGCEILEQLGKVRPTHIFLQAGVGSLAGALAAFFASVYGDGQEAPVVTVVEPTGAACVFKTAQANDGKLHFAGKMQTIMAGLCCGEPCRTAWEILHDHADYFATIPDEAAATGMRILGHPLPGDQQIISGESGASTFGLVAAVLRQLEYAAVKAQLGLDNKSRILCISTEGDTDQANYRRIVWDGAWGTAK